MTIGKRIRHERLKCGLSQEELAKALSTTKQAIYKYENNIVYVKLLGACIGCSSSEDTINNSVEALLVEEVPGVIGVEQVIE